MTTNELERQEADVSTLPNGTTLERGEQFHEPAIDDGTTWQVIEAASPMDGFETSQPFVWLSSGASGGDRWIGHTEFADMLDAGTFEREGEQ